LTFFLQVHWRIAILTANLKVEASLLEKVSARIEASKPAPQIAANEK
jgi:hypothetical protein